MYKFKTFMVKQFPLLLQEYCEPILGVEFDLLKLSNCFLLDLASGNFANGAKKEFSKYLEKKKIN